MHMFLSNVCLAQHDICFNSISCSNFFQILIGIIYT
jgi:hypothetical protein